MSKPKSDPLLDALKPGATVTITTSLGDSVEGTVYHYDQVAGCVVIETSRNAPKDGPKDFTVIATTPPGSIEVFVIKSPTRKPPQSTKVVSAEVIQARTLRAINDRKMEAAKIGQGVTQMAQMVFDSLAKIMPCKWERQTIIVMDAVRIESPYGVEDCSGGTKATLSRVQGILKRNLNRLGL
jgi:hypothetical protein